MGPAQGRGGPGRRGRPGGCRCLWQGADPYLRILSPHLRENGQVGRLNLGKTITPALGSHQDLQAGRPWQKSCASPLPTRQEAHPAMPNGQGQDSNRQAWMAENRLKRTSGDSSARRPEEPFSERASRMPVFFFCAHKCHPIAMRPLRLNNKAERVSAWGAGLWAVCQGCQAAQTSIPTELKDKKTAPVKLGGK